ncbi:UDP-glycosyltransferase 73E1-like [Cornus florida]|uniref:UDP-glycosyltransferase 73E1-like n=1 Tax=Cornus florida TaxID=4283 RepID=UPI00289DC410|nr:UDP-glycosyltransferase 73E1-like [Cornus florida]
MSSQKQLLHFVLLPHLAHGHLIPMIDMARLLAQHGVTVTIVTTPLNATRFRSNMDRAIESGLQIQLLQVPFPSTEAGLPEGCESMDNLPSRDSFKNLLVAIRMLQSPIENLFNELQPRISCIISDKNLPWTAETASKLCIPRLVFDGTSCFSLLCTHNILNSRIHECALESEAFVVPGLPDQIELTRAQLPNAVNMDNASDMRRKIREAELAAYWVVVNTFEELEPAYIEEFRKVRGCKVWCIGPVSLCNKENVDRIERGNKTSIDENQLVKWLDSKEPSSVVYTCLGSQSRLTAPQLIELGLGLEASKQPFIWVIRGGNKSQELEKWMSEEGFEERTKGRGLLIRGWAPQILILSHPSIGGFLTHCGWNSTLEGICAGVPMITWPLFAEQFYNEKFMVQVLRIGVRVGAEFAVKWGEEEKFGVLVKKEEVKKAIQQVMDGGEEGQERRKRARELGKMANRALEEGGSSYLNMALLIKDIRQQLMINQS